MSSMENLHHTPCFKALTIKDSSDNFSFPPAPLFFLEGFVETQMLWSSTAKSIIASRIGSKRGGTGLGASVEYDGQPQHIPFSSVSG